MKALPRSGIYCLIIDLDKSATITVGKLGSCSFCEGTYVYVGSAQSNLPARVARHCRKEKTLRWHIDYLLKESEVEEIIAFAALKEAECAVSQLTLRFENACQPIKGFGASDCRCFSHLTFFPSTSSTQVSQQLHSILREMGLLP